MTKDELDRMMSRKKAAYVCKHMGNSTITDLEKDRAVRKAIGSSSIQQSLTKPDVLQILQWVFRHYMKEEE